MFYINKNLNMITFDTSIYYLQKQLAFNLYFQVRDVNYSTVCILLLAGIITSLNPCMLSILPLTMSYLTVENSKKQQVNDFILGLITSFFLFFLLALVCNRKYIRILHIFPILSSIGIIFIGLNLLQIFNFTFLSLNFSLFKSEWLQDKINNYMTGLTLGFSSFPCSASLFVTVALWLSYSSSYLVCAIYGFIYLVGAISPLIVLINLTSLYVEFINITSVFKVVILISGCFFIGSGIFSLLSTLCI